MLPYTPTELSFCSYFPILKWFHLSAALRTAGFGFWTVIDRKIKTNDSKELQRQLRTCSCNLQLTWPVLNCPDVVNWKSKSHPAVTWCLVKNDFLMWMYSEWKVRKETGEGWLSLPFPCCLTTITTARTPTFSVWQQAKCVTKIRTFSLITFSFFCTHSLCLSFTQA